MWSRPSLTLSCFPPALGMTGVVSVTPSGHCSPWSSQNETSIVPSSGGLELFHEWFWGLTHHAENFTLSITIRKLPAGYPWDNSTPHSPSSHSLLALPRTEELPDEQKLQKTHQTLERFDQKPFPDVAGKDWLPLCIPWMFPVPAEIAPQSWSQQQTHAEVSAGPWAVTFFLLSLSNSPGAKGNQ